jgi:hypothetical protein
VGQYLQSLQSAEHAVGKPAFNTLDGFDGEQLLEDFFAPTFKY